MPQTTIGLCDEMHLIRYTLSVLSSYRRNPRFKDFMMRFNLEKLG